MSGRKRVWLVVMMMIRRGLLKLGSVSFWLRL